MVLTWADGPGLYEKNPKFSSNFNLALDIFNLAQAYWEVIPQIGEYLSIKIIDQEFSWLKQQTTGVKIWAKDMDKNPEESRTRPLSCGSIGRMLASMYTVLGLILRLGGKKVQ